MLNSRNARWLEWLSPAVILAIGLIAYWPVFFYNFFWEDPFDIGQVEWYSVGQLLAVPQSNSYYRPLSLIIFKALSYASPAHPAWMYHLFVVSGHLAAAVLLFGLARYLFGRREFALAASLIFLLYQVSFEATARASNLHEWLAPLLFVSLWLYAWGRRTGRRWPFFVTLAVIALAQAFQENGLTFPVLLLLLELFLAWQKRVERFHPAVLIYFLPALLFLLIWSRIPKGGEPPQLGLHPREALYVSQGISFPFAGPISWMGGLGLSPEWQAGAALILAAGVLALAHGRENAPRLTLALAWWAGAISLAWIARPIEYLQVSPRVMYFPSFGASLAWAGVIDLGASWLRREATRRTIGVIVLGVVLLECSFVLSRSVELYRRGSNLMDEIIPAGGRAGAGGRLLFVNVPDRFEYRVPLYPLGYWGMLLAPVSQDLSDFVRFATNVKMQTRSLSDFPLLAGMVDASSYRVNTRGVDAHASDLMYDTILWADETYWTDYDADGAMRLRPVGDVRASRTIAGFIGRFGVTSQLLSVDAQTEAGAIRLTLCWSALQSAHPTDTIFVHLFDSSGALVGQADGDSLGGLLPPSAWRPGDEIVDRRTLVTNGPLPVGEYRLTVGFYDRADGSRYPAYDARGREAADGELEVLRLNLPPE
ncbi:MAG: hypothetical protein HY023_07555 [Chloroflexi bacterium]|nr:hypothetical protein [Chloroflexota bacterium]